jgi:hypothetical protein
MGPVRVWRQSGTDKQQLKVRAAGGGGIALLHARSAATLSAQVHLSVPSWQMPGANPIPAYFISGEYTATALEIPAPVKLTESASDAAGVRRYSLSTLHGLEFVNPTEPYYWDARPTPSVSWRFIPDVGTAQRVGECDNETFCTYKPEKAGEMEATTYVEGQQVVVRGSAVPFVPPVLQLTCNADTITRGAALNCSVSAQPSGTLSDIQWTFLDSAGNTIRDSIRANWDGLMVVGGSLGVTAKIDGTPFSEDTVIMIRPRKWGSPVPARREAFQRCPVITPTCVVLYPPVQYRDMGTTVKQPSSFNLVVRASTITSGPNAGWSYLMGSDSPIQFREQVIILNEVLNLGNGDPATRQFWAGQPQCVPSAVLQDVRAHENRHADLYEQRRQILDSEIERSTAFVPAAQWISMLRPGGTEATRVANRLHELDGGLHRPVDGFPLLSCALILAPN